MECILYQILMRKNIRKNCVTFLSVRAITLHFSKQRTTIQR